MPAGFQVIQKGVVQAVFAARRGCQGVLMSGAEFFAYYYGATPVIGDIVFLTETADGSWIVVTGPTGAQGLFGVGGDRDVTLTASTTSDSVSRNATTTASMTYNTATITCSSGDFTAADVGKLVSGTGLPAGTRIVSVASSTSITVSNYPTSSSGGFNRTITVTERNRRWTVAGSVITLQRDLYCVNLTLDPSAGAFTVFTNGYRIFCLGTFTIGQGITVHNNGNAAVGSTAGGNAAAGTVGRAVGAGAAGVGLGGGGGVAGTAGTAVTTSAATISTSAVASGGGGGNAHDAASANAGGAGGTIINATADGWPAAVPSIVMAQALTGVLFAGGAGGGAGACKGAVGAGGTGVSGGGGGGGGVVAIYARVLVNLGTIAANGGAGGAASATGATNAAFGGGGGGGGGVVILVYGAAGSFVGQVLTEGGDPGGGFAGTGGLGSSAPPSEGFVYTLGSFGGASPSGGTGGAAASAGATYTGLAGRPGAPGLVWALPL